jgi:hypothetical protein
MKNIRKISMFLALMMIVSAFALTTFAGSELELAAIVDHDTQYDVIEPHSILCIFGHNLNFGSIRTVRHRIYATNPRCTEEVASIEYCVRNNCHFFNVRSQITRRITCC